MEKKKTRRLLSFILLTLLLASLLAGCGEKTEEFEYSCTVSVRCDAALQNMDKLASGKDEIIPENGVMLEETVVGFNDGESVFDALRRALTERKMHLEYMETPVYGSVYIEGICNLYEFDCGELSGWEYSVNGEFPSIASSETKLNDGDEVRWLYTCDLGADIGDVYHE